MVNRYSGIVIGLLSVLCASGQEFDRIHNAADGVASLNSELLQNSLEEPGRIRNRLERRLPLLSELIRLAPASALSLALPADTRERLRARLSGAAGQIENFGEWNGAAQVIVEDDFQRGTSRTHVSLADGNDRLEVYFAGTPPHLKCGDTLRVRGMRLGNALAAEAATVTGLAAAASCSGSGNQSIAVLLVNFGNTTLPAGVTPEFVNDVFFGSGRSVDGFWREESYGATWATGAVFGPFTLSQSLSCDQNQAVMNAAIQAAAPTVDFSTYNRIFIIMPQSGSCPGGYGMVGCGGISTPSGYVTGSVTWLTADTFAAHDYGVETASHEGGHNLGLSHASSLAFAGPVPLGAPGDPGTHNEYGDIYSNMGSGFLAYGSYFISHYAAPHKSMLGWFGPGNVQTVTANGTFVLQPYETATAGIQVLKMLRPGTNTWLWIEYRQPLGYDVTVQPFGNQIFSGALIHYEDPFSYSGYTHLLAFNPSSPGNFYAPALPAGSSWQDPYSPLSLTVNSATPAGLSVTVSFGGISSPALSISKIHSGNFTAGQTGAQYTVTVSNAAGAATTSGVVTVTETVPTGLTLTSMSGTGWSCLSNTCSRSEPLTGGSSYPPITVGVNVAANASSPLLNQVSVSGGGSAPASTTDSTTILQPPDLTISKTHLGSFIPGQTGATYTITVSNNGVGPTNGTVTVTDTLPAGLSPSAISGAGWVCSLSPLGCARVDALGAGASYPVIYLTVNVAPSAPASVTNTATVSGGGDSNTSNNTASDPTVIQGIITGVQFVPVAPCRILDTRGASGPFGGPRISGLSTRTIPMLSSPCGIPSTAVAYSLNATVVPRAGTLGYLTLWPTGQAQPGSSTLNSPDGSILANAAIIPAGSGGSINAYALQDTDLVLDINGYFVPPGAGTLQFYPLAPCRVLDTRGPTGTFGGPALTAGIARSFPIRSSACGVPATAQAYSFNVTAVPHGRLGFLTLWPTGQLQPNASTLNSDGTILANAAIAAAGADGAVNFYAMNTTDLVLDINGYFAAPGPGGLNFYPANPCRLLDTRGPNGSFGGPIMNGTTTRTFPLPASGCALPSTAGAYSLNVTVQPSGPLGYLTIWPAGQSQPGVSTLNADKGLVLANAALVPGGTSGSVNIYVLGTTHVIVDTNGYFQ